MKKKNIIFKGSAEGDETYNGDSLQCVFRFNLFVQDSIFSNIFRLKKIIFLSVLKILYHISYFWVCPQSLFVEFTRDFTLHIITVQVIHIYYKFVQFLKSNFSHGHCKHSWSRPTQLLKYGCQVGNKKWRDQGFKQSIHWLSYWFIIEVLVILNIWGEKIVSEI